MEVWQDELIIHTFHGHELLEGTGGFIVQALKFGAQTCGTQVGVPTL